MCNVENSASRFSSPPHRHLPLPARWVVAAAILAEGRRGFAPAQPGRERGAAILAEGTGAGSRERHRIRAAMGVEDRAAAPRHAGEHHPAAGRGRGLPMLKCGNCGEVSEKWQYLRLMDSAPLKGGRGSATMVQKCKLCSRENSIDILSQTIKPYNAEDSEKFKTIVEFECRGLEPVDFQPQAGFAAEGAESGTPFNDINLLEKDWNDYDEKTKESVGIYEVTHKFVKC
ncbi:CXXC motif containing zinc binding protein isoform X2 [Onychostruthus taczanowskii]|nr:CXXC motif containing zinc binding protein isoform X2 [Onychostruthus taczanowskii]